MEKQECCGWKETRDQKGTYLTSCGKFFTPEPHNQNLNYSDFKYCPACGKLIIESVVPAYRKGSANGKKT